MNNHNDHQSDEELKEENTKLRRKIEGLKSRNKVLHNHIGDIAGGFNACMNRVNGVFIDYKFRDTTGLINTCMNRVNGVFIDYRWLTKVNSARDE